MSSESSSHVVYRETGSAAFSLRDFLWREIKLRAVPCPARKPGDRVQPLLQRAGGFSYRNSSSLGSLTRNRFILWHYQEGRLKLLELSLDLDLAYNAVELVLESPDLLPDVSIHEVEVCDVVVLFGTSTTVYRLTLPHPARIKQTPALSRDVGKGRVPSVLNFASEANFVGPNSAALFNQVNSVPMVTSCAACVGIDRVATFALASPSGPIAVIQLQEQGLPVRLMLQETSVMSMLSSFLPGMGRRQVGGTAEDAPVALLVHEFEEQPVVLAFCADAILRVWSVQLSQCVMTHDLSGYLLNKDEVGVAGVEVDKMCLRAAPDSTPSILTFAVHLRNGSLSQISLFEVELLNNQLHMILLHSRACPQDYVLTDFSISRSELWAMWQGKVKDSNSEGVVIKQVIYDVPSPTEWREVGVSTLPDSQLFLLPHLEPREFYMSAIFHPGRFSTHAIYKTLELYECPPDASEGVPGVEDLAREVCLRVEHELHSCVGSQQLDSDDYRELSVKCWSKFYRCCVEYQELASHPLALVQDPHTGMGVVIKHSLFSLLRPAHLVECIGSQVPLHGDNSELVGNIRNFLAYIRHVLNKLSPDILESFIHDLGCYGSADMNPPIVLAGDLAQAIQAEGWDRGLYKQLGSIPDMAAILDTLLATLTPTHTSDEADMDDDDTDQEDDADMLKAVGGLFGGSVAMTSLSCSLMDVCRYRLCLCRDVLVALLMLRRKGGRDKGKELLSYVSNTNYQTEFSRLIQRYYSLYWLASHTYLPTHSTLDSSPINLQQLAALDISGSQGKRDSQAPPTSPLTSLSSLPHAYLALCGSKEVVGELVKRPALFQDGSPALWAACYPAVMEGFIKALWPVDRATEVAKFLLESSQHSYLQAYVETVLGHHNLPSNYTLYYLLGQSLILTGELQKAFSCFNRASNGIMSRSNPFLCELVQLDSVGVALTKEERKGRKEACLARYYEKVMRLFEDVSSARYVIATAQEATRLLPKRDEKSTVFWSVQFKYQLELGDGREAYDAMMAIPDYTLRVDCLRQLIIVLAEQNRIQELCEFEYTGLEREVETVMEQRARSVDVVRYHYYDLLYCYHVSRNNRRKAAYVMYENAQRLEREAKGPSILKRLADCYSMTILLLSLVETKYAWVLRPVQEQPVSDKRKSMRKRLRSGEKRGGQVVEVLTVADIDKSYSLVRAKLKLLQVSHERGSLETQLTSPFITVEEVVSLLVQCGMFDDAVVLAKKFSFPLTSIFEALASRCVQLSTNFMTLTESSVDQPGWEWLDYNKTLDNVKVKENSIADKAWYLLETSIQRLAGTDHAVVLRSVARKLLSLGHALPQWLLDKYKKTNAAELLHLYLAFDLLELAALLGMEYIDGVMGCGKEYFGLETGLHADFPSVWLPYHLLSHLQLALKNAPEETNFKQLSEDLKDKLGRYVHQAHAVSDNKEEGY